MGTRRKRLKRRKGLEANYGDATPEQVAEALLRWNPNGPNRTRPANKPGQPVNPSL